MCDVNAYCENTIGSYDCICVDGYVENGTFCMSKQFQIPCEKNTRGLVRPSGPAFWMVHLVGA